MVEHNTQSTSFLQRWRPNFKTQKITKFMFLRSRPEGTRSWTMGQRLSGWPLSVTLELRTMYCVVCTLHKCLAVDPSEIYSICRTTTTSAIIIIIAIINIKHTCCYSTHYTGMYWVFAFSTMISFTFRLFDSHLIGSWINTQYNGRGCEKILNTTAEWRPAVRNIATYIHTRLLNT